MCTSCSYNMYLRAAFVSLGVPNCAATIWRWGLFEVSNYSRAVTIRGWNLIEEKWQTQMKSFHGIVVRKALGRVQTFLPIFSTAMRQSLEQRDWIWGWLLRTFLHGFLDDLCVGSECLQHLQNQLLCWKCHGNKKTHYISHDSTKITWKHFFLFAATSLLLTQEKGLFFTKRIKHNYCNLLGGLTQDS